MVMVVVYLLRENVSSVKLRHAYKQNRREFQNELKPVTHMISSPHLTRTRSNAPFTLPAPQPDSSSQQHKPPLLPLVRTEPHATSSILSPDAVSHAPRSENCRYTYHVRKRKDSTSETARDRVALVCPGLASNVYVPQARETTPDPGHAVDSAFVHAPVCCWRANLTIEPRRLPSHTTVARRMWRRIL